MKADELKRLLKSNPSLPILHVSDPIDGDCFAFGTLEELEGELEAYEEKVSHEIAELTTAGELANSLDFEAYEDQDIRVLR